MNKMNLSSGEQAELLAYLQKTYEYDNELGRLRNRKTGRIPKYRFSRTNRYPRHSIWFNGKMYYPFVHRLVWAVYYGRWPVGQLDHINGDRLDNHIENLREVSHSENQLNQLHPWRPNKETGVPGFNICGNRFRTSIGGRYVYFPSPYAAFVTATMLGKRYR